MPGSKNRRTLLGVALAEALTEGSGALPDAFTRWAALLVDPDPKIRLEAEEFLFRVLFTAGTTPTDPEEPRRLVIEYVNDWRKPLAAPPVPE